jgi:tetratricopeptide (TPR) repeat protein
MRRIGVVSGGLALAWLAACESTQQRSAPGVLPTERSDVTPQVNASTYVAHGHLLERQGKYEQAATQYRRALELTPGLLVARNRLGIALNRLGKHAEASEQFRTVLARGPNLAYAHNNLGFSLLLEDKYAEAERELARALELTAAFPRARMNHGVALAKLGRYDEALAEFGIVCGEADAHYNLSIFQAESGHYAEAARSLERALQVQPDLEAARQQLREISRLAAEQEEAERVAAEAAAAASQQAAASVPPASVAQAPGSEQAVTPTEVMPTSDVQPASHVEPLPANTPEQPPAPAQTPTGVDKARIVEQILSLVATAEGPMPPDDATSGAIGNDELIAMFNELIEASPRGVPWWDGYLQRLRDTLTRSSQPQPTPPDPHSPPAQPTN